MQINITDNWYKMFNQSHIGFLLINQVDNTKASNPLNTKKKGIRVPTQKNL